MFSEWLQRRMAKKKTKLMCKYSIPNRKQIRWFCLILRAGDISAFYTSENRLRRRGRLLLTDLGILSQCSQEFLSLSPSPNMRRSAMLMVIGEEDHGEPVILIFGENKDHALFAIVRTICKNAGCTRSSWNKRPDTKERRKARYIASCVAMLGIGKIHVRSSLHSVARSQSRAQFPGGNVELFKHDWQ
jgi:hypothetical protein